MAELYALALADRLPIICPLEV